MASENLHQVFAEFKNKTILVLGDVMLDHTTHGEVTHISPEAPVPIFKKISESYTFGGAANVANNLVALGAKVILGGVVGNDHEKDIFLSLLKEKGILDELLIIDETRPTTTKNRLVSGVTQLMRVDHEETHPLTSERVDELYRKVSDVLPTCDGIVFSDYAKGFLSHDATPRIISDAKKLGKITLADLKPINKRYFYHADVVVPNLKEGKEIAGSVDVLEIGSRIIAEFGSNLFLTRSADGISVFMLDGSHEHIPGKKVGIYDISGAGDVSAAVGILALVSGLGYQDAARLANHAGHIAVQKPGTSVVSIEELASSVLGEQHLEEVPMVHKVWGYERWLENNEKYCCKLLSLNKGYQCSLHFHKHKDEMFLVMKGHVRLELEEQVIHMHAGNFMRIPPGTLHRFRGIEDSLIVETSTHHDESDSHRLEESCMTSETV